MFFINKSDIVTYSLTRLKREVTTTEIQPLEEPKGNGKDTTGDVPEFKRNKNLSEVVSGG